MIQNEAILALEQMVLGMPHLKRPQMIIHIAYNYIWQFTRGFGGTIFSDKSSLVPGGYLVAIFHWNF